MKKDLRNRKLGAVRAPIARWALAAFALTPVLMQEGHARDVGALGGGGGSEFRATCRPNGVLTGFIIQSGKALDSITPYCAGLNAETTAIDTPLYPLERRGGKGGTIAYVQCRTGYAVRHLHVYMDNAKIVNHIRITCQALNSGDWHNAVPANIGGKAVGDVRFSCGDGEWGTGIYGRSGDLVDQLGLQCDKFVAETTPLPDVITRNKVPPTEIITAPKPPDTGPKPVACAVRLDTNIFTACQGDETGEFLAENTQGVTLLNRCAADANWFNLKWPAGQGWVFSGPDHESLDCK